MFVFMSAADSIDMGLCMNDSAIHIQDINLNTLFASICHSFMDDHMDDLDYFYGKSLHERGARGASPFPPGYLESIEKHPEWHLFLVILAIACALCGICRRGAQRDPFEVHQD